MDYFEEALRNIDVFCKVLVDKMIGNEENSNVTVEPMEKLLYDKCVMGAETQPNASSGKLIPLPQLDEPLIDVLEESDHVKILMQCRCKDQKVSVQADLDGVKICKKECRSNADGTETCTDNCQKLNLPIDHSKVDNMVAKCNNNAVFEVTFQK
jgi:hypothetical protein